MTDSLERTIATSGNIFGIAVNTTNLINEAIQRHDLGPTAAAALGRALTGSILLAALLKDNQSIHLTFEGNGPLGKVVAEAGSEGWCRGYVGEPHADVPLKDGAIDVAGGLGLAGFLRVAKNIGMKEKYTGLVQLFTSEIGDDIAYYLTESEQTPSAVGLGVHLQPNGSAYAGGYLIQSLPPADESIIGALEQKISTIPPVTELLRQGATPGNILSKLFSDIPHKFTGTSQPYFSCTCSTEKMKSILQTLSDDDIDYLFEKKEDISMKCDYCSDIYNFSLDVIQSLKKRKY